MLRVGALQSSNSESKSLEAQVARVAAAFMRAEVTALAWLHLLLLDLFQARWIPPQVLLHVTSTVYQTPPRLSETCRC